MPPHSETVAAVGEDALVAVLTRDLPQTSRTVIGPGDDCAVLRGPGRNFTLLKTDCLIQDVHFTMKAAPERIGWKALCRVISDIASMGGRPQEMLVTVALPGSTPAGWVQELYAGLTKAARAYGAGIAGGETTSVPPGGPIMISVAGVGLSGRPVLRSGARPGDAVCVTGKLGGSLAGWHLDFTPRLAAASWLVSHCRPSAMMDLSDGIARDLPRLAHASRCGFHLDLESVPLHERTLVLDSPAARLHAALSDGEDYELLFTLSRRKLNTLQKDWPFAASLPFSVIGSVLENVEARTALTGGWQHFQ